MTNTKSNQSKITSGIFYHEESAVRIVNENWTLLVYIDLKQIKTTLDRIAKILSTMEYVFEQDNPRLTAFEAEIKTHYSLLNRISRALEILSSIG